MANAVRVTFGPKLRCVLIDKRWSKPFVCNDGVTIAKELEVHQVSGALLVHFVLQMRSFSASHGALNHSKYVKRGVYEQGRLN
jgi:chaperonin GroEL (HSP60 family)